MTGTILDLRALWMALQPIVGLNDGRVVGHEALLRGPAGSPWAMPAAILRNGAETGWGQELETICRRLALDAGGRLPVEQRLFVNVDAHHPDLLFDSQTVGLATERVVIEVSEERDVVDHPAVLAALHHWRQQGYRIALDDYGAGRSNLSTLLAVQPDIIKMDRAITARVCVDPRHRVVVQALVRLAEELRIDLVAEGIETPSQLDTLRELGVQLGQGYLFGRPDRHPAASGAVRLAAANRTPFSVRSRQAQTTTPLTSFDAAFFDSVSVAAYYVDKRRTILRWNAAAEAISGWTAKEVVGRRCMAGILDHRGLDGTPLCWGACPLVHVMAEGKLRRETVLMRHREGQRIAVTVEAVPVVGPGGGVVGAVELFYPAGAPPTDPQDP